MKKFHVEKYIQFSSSSSYFNFRINKNNFSLTKFINWLIYIAERKERSLSKPLPSIPGLVRRIRKVLAEGPSTVREVATTLGRKPRAVQGAMWILMCEEQVQPSGFIPNDKFGKRGEPKRFKLYDLTSRGRKIFEHPEKRFKKPV